MMRHGRHPHPELVALTVGRVSQLIERTIGLTLSATAPGHLYDFLSQRADALELRDAAHYVDLLERVSIHDPELTRLINLVTNGLTAFWRDEPQLEAIRLVLEQIGRERDLTRQPISIWCAGCSTGEEAYTLAMLAIESNLPVSILGTDINTESLHAATQGAYHTWSLRRLSEDRKARYFEVLAHPDHFAIHPSLRALVSFAKHNLLDPPPHAPWRPGWDVILCRNVLIYFDKGVVRSVIGRFAMGIQTDGYLMLGSSEQMFSYFAEERSPFRAAKHGAGFVYRLASKPPGTTVYKVPLIRQVDPLQDALRASGEHDASSLHEVSEGTQEGMSEEAIQNLVQVGCRMLDKDQDHAIACFEAALSYDPFTTDAYYGIAYLLRGSAPQQAMEVLRKILFLRPMHWLAAYWLGKLHEQNGALTRARRLYRQALEGLAADEPLFELPEPAVYFNPTTREREHIQAHCIQNR